jgi:predicted XRE-type DNA-binding protein
MKTPIDVETSRRLRSDIARQISQFVDGQKLNRVAASKLLRIRERTLSKVVQGRISGLSLDLLMRMAARAGLHVDMQISVETTREMTPEQRLHAYVRLCELRAQILNSP